MKLYRSSEVPVDAPGMICCESRLVGVVRAIVWSGLLVLPVVLGWKSGYPWVAGIGAMLLLVMVPLLVRDVASQFRGTNWVLRICSDGVWINLQTYRDKPSEALSVVRLDYQEIASVGRHTEKCSTPSEMTTSSSQGAAGGDTLWKDLFLEFRLTQEETGELRAVLNQLRARSVPGQGSSGAPKPGSWFFPVWLVAPDALRVTWVSGHGHVIAPRLGQALAELETYVQQAEPTARERPNWRKLSVPEVDELAHELIHVHGAHAEAVALLVRAAGITDPQARTLVQRMIEAGVT